jgi:hypothetical protein
MPFSNIEVCHFSKCVILYEYPFTNYEEAKAVVGLLTPRLRLHEEQQKYYGQLNHIRRGKRKVPVTPLESKTILMGRKVNQVTFFTHPQYHVVLQRGTIYKIFSHKFLSTRPQSSGKT